MECKAEQAQQIEQNKTVLIETSWNVKPSILKGDVQDNSVLIETSWNVKQSAKTTLKPKYQSINRNIVECKAVNKLTSFLTSLY